MLKRLEFLKRRDNNIIIHKLSIATALIDLSCIVAGCALRGEIQTSQNFEPRNAQPVTRNSQHVTRNYAL